MARKQREAVEPEAAIEPQEPAEPTRVVLCLAREAALGEGTRRRGLVVGTAEAREGAPGWEPTTIEWDEALAPHEQRTLALNHQLIERQ